MEGDEYMQAISVSEAKQNFEKHCEDVIEKSDVIIVSRSGNGKENMVWINLSTYNELQKTKEEGKIVIKTVKKSEDMEDE